MAPRTTWRFHPRRRRRRCPVFWRNRFGRGEAKPTARQRSTRSSTGASHPPSSIFVRLFITFGILSARAYAHGLYSDHVGTLTADGGRCRCPRHYTSRSPLGRRSGRRLDKPRERLNRQRLVTENG